MAIGVTISRLWVRPRAPPTLVSPAASSDIVKSGIDVHVPAAELEDLIGRCLVAAGASPDHAPLVAKVLVAADRRGIPSHGVNRAEFYCAELQANLIDGAATPVLAQDGPATAVVDARNGLGAVAADFAVKVAIRKARETGVAVVCVHHSNHYGIAGYWADLALQERLIGFSFTNTSPFMVPTRAKSRAAGTNPIACYCPAGADSFQLDMATTTVPVGKVEVCHRKRQKIPFGWGLNSRGLPTDDPEEVFDNGGLLPVGGTEDTAGYKGYGLAMLVEILTAVLPGDAAVGPDVQPWTCTRTQPLNYGHCFIVLDPARFCGSAFESRLADYLQKMRGLTPSGERLPVLVPGDVERAEECLAATHGVRLNRDVAAGVKRLAERLNIHGLPAALQALDTHTVVEHTGVTAK